MTADKQLLELARAALSEDEFRVWFTKHHGGLGRRAGSIALGISEEAYRHRLARATRKLDRAVAEQEDIGEYADWLREP